MEKYKEGKIYKIFSVSKNLVYYGSTIFTLDKRLQQHLYKFNSKECSSHLILECDDYKIELVQNYPCNNRKELCKKEGEYIKNNKCINKVISGRPRNEWLADNTETRLLYQKNYSKAHKEHVLEINKNYRKENKQKIQEYKKQWYQAKKQNDIIYNWLILINSI